jgi:signal transduction histidine kinase
MIDKRGDSDFRAYVADVDPVTDISAHMRVGFEPSELIACLSHEMRTPLSAILGYAQLMESATPTPTMSQRKSIERILQAGWHLEKLISMTRDLALIESGTLSLSLEPVPLAEILSDCKSRIESHAKMRGVNVSFPPSEMHFHVSGDRIRLQEVFNSLLYAAIEYSEVDGTVVVACEANGAEWIRIGVNDGGEGLVEGRRAPSSQPFEGLEQKQSPSLDGTGVGVRLAKRLVGLMGGVFSSDTIERKSKAFSFYLKSVFAPMVAGRTYIQSAVGEADVANGRWSHSTAPTQDILARKNG